MFSSKANPSAQAYLPPGLNGGTYVNASLKIGWKKHLGFNGEVAGRYKKGLYNGYQDFRPVLYDFNAVWSDRFTEKTGGDIMAGAGGESLIFYNQFATCPPGLTVCSIYASDSHLLVHVGGDLRYYFRGRLFVRPELHYYRVVNNFELHTGNLFRAGASVGFSFGTPEKVVKPKK
jgi:hypothetical protein